MLVRYWAQKVLFPIRDSKSQMWTPETERAIIVVVISEVIRISGATHKYLFHLLAQPMRLKYSVLTYPHGVVFEVDVSFCILLISLYGVCICCKNAVVSLWLLFKLLSLMWSATSEELDTKKDEGKGRMECWCSFRYLRVHLYLF